MQKKTLTPQEFAARFGLNLFSVQRLLLAESKLPPAQRTLPGAFKVGEGKRGNWYIPIEDAEKFAPRERGRPKKKG